MRKHTIAANEFCALTTERYRLCSRAMLAHRFHLPLRLRHFAEQIFYSLHEERALQLLYAAGGRGLLATLGIGKGPPSIAFRQFLDTRPTVVVIAGQQLGLQVVALASSSSKRLSLVSGASAISIIGASVSEAPLVDSTDALSRYII